MGSRKINLPTGLLAFLLAALVSFSGEMCLVEAFSLSSRMTSLLLVCCLAAALAACAMVPRRRWPMVTAVVVLWLGAAYWQQATLVQGVQALLFAVTSEYGQVFDGIAVMGQAGDCLLLLSFLSVPMAWVTAWIICRAGNGLLLALMCLPILLLCLVIVDLAPVLWLVVLSFSLLLLLLTHGVRDHSAAEGSRLGWWLLLPTVILVTAITVIWPPADYARADWSEELRAVVEHGISLETLQTKAVQKLTAAATSSRKQQQVDLGSLGPKAMTGKKVLESQSVQSRYYLRGMSLGVYDDNCWSAVKESDYEAAEIDLQPLLAVEGSGTLLSLQVKTENVEELLYTTYVLGAVPESAVLVDDAYAENGGKLLEYRVDYYAAAGGSGTATAAYDAYVAETYTQLPQSLRQALEEFLAEMGWEPTSSPERIAELVKNLGEYDLNTPKLPQGEEFVLYFLRESRRGYCVHFATATAALLRAVGIPARYVTGYAVSGGAGQWVTVTEDDAHAWVEYYANGVGWLPLDPTPAAQQQAQPVVTPETPTEPESQTPETALTRNEVPETENAAPSAKPTAPAAPEQARSAPLLWLLAIPAAVGLVLLRYHLTLRRRRERCRRGEPNRRAMAYWRWLVLLARQEGTALEEELICLAEKARFSQHDLTGEELAVMQQALEARIARLKQYPAAKQLWLRLILALY